MAVRISVRPMATIWHEQRRVSCCYVSQADDVYEQNKVWKAKPLLREEQRSYESCCPASRLGFDMSFGFPALEIQGGKKRDAIDKMGLISLPGKGGRRDLHAG